MAVYRSNEIKAWVTIVTTINTGMTYTMKFERPHSWVDLLMDKIWAPMIGSHRSPTRKSAKQILNNSLVAGPRKSRDFIYPTKIAPLKNTVGTQNKKFKTATKVSVSLNPLVMVYTYCLPSSRWGPGQEMFRTLVGGGLPVGIV